MNTQGHCFHKKKQNKKTKKMNCHGLLGFIFPSTKPKPKREFLLSEGIPDLQS